MPALVTLTAANAGPSAFGFGLAGIQGAPSLGAAGPKASRTRQMPDRCATVYDPMNRLWHNEFGGMLGHPERPEAHRAA